MDSSSLVLPSCRHVAESWPPNGQHQSLKTGSFPFFLEFMVAELSIIGNIDKSSRLEGGHFSGDASRGPVSEI